MASLRILPAPVHRLLLISVLALCAALSGCEEPVDLDIELPEPRLVLNSTFFPDEVVRIQLTATRTLGNETAQSREVTTAEVMLFDGNDMVESLTYVPSASTGGVGEYRTQTFRPLMGREYTLLVSAPGFPPVSAVSSIPPPVPLTTVAVAEVATVATEEVAVYDYKLHVDYADPAEEVNYYDLRVRQLAVPYTIAYNGDTIRQLPQMKGILAPALYGERSGEVSLLIQDLPPGGVIDVELRSVIDPRKELLGNLVAELRTVSREYYFFQRTVNQSLGTPGGGLAQPVVIFSNASQGLGVFAGYNSVTTSVPLHLNH